MFLQKMLKVYVFITPCLDYCNALFVGLPFALNRSILTHTKRSAHILFKLHCLHVSSRIT